MARRQSHFDVWTSEGRSTWLSVETLEGEVLELKALKPSSDLRAAFLKVLARLQSEGWLLETPGELAGQAVVAKGAERRQVKLTRNRPG